MNVIQSSMGEYSSYSSHSNAMCTQFLPIFTAEAKSAKYNGFHYVLYNIYTCIPLSSTTNERPFKMEKFLKANDSRRATKNVSALNGIL